MRLRCLFEHAAAFSAMEGMTMRRYDELLYRLMNAVRDLLDEGKVLKADEVERAWLRWTDRQYWNN